MEMAPSVEDIVQRHQISEYRKAVTDVVHQKREAEKSSMTDTLTGLPNRRSYDITMEKEIERSKRGQHPLVFMIVDIDHFKVINDTKGHPTGDLVLGDVAKILKQNTRAGDTVARIGGEEFGIILPETDLAQADIVARKLLKAIQTETLRKDAYNPVTISGGYSLFGDQHTTNKEELEKAADKALNDAKRAGRNRMLPFQIGRKTNPDALRVHTKAHIKRAIPAEMDVKSKAQLFRELLVEAEQEIAEKSAKPKFEANG